MRRAYQGDHAIGAIARDLDTRGKGNLMKRLLAVLFLLGLHMSVHALPQNLQRSGPRTGFTVTQGKLADSYKERNLTPISSLFGWQFEQSVASAPDESLAVIFEQIPLLGGLDQGLVSPSLSLLVGVRSASGFELAVGTTFLGPTYLIDQKQWVSKEFIKSAHVTLAAGWTLQAGRINFPLNLVWSPSRDPQNRGSWTTFTVGMNWAAMGD
jgi:hypothetical protein